MFRPFVAGVLLCSCVCGCNDVRSMRRSRDVEGLVKLLSDPDEHVRIKAADALGYVGDTRAVPSLIKILRDRSPFVREHAARNLGCDDHSSLGCDTGDHVEPLMALLDDDDVFVRVEAARSLGEHPLPASRSPLEKLAVSDERWEVRQAAVYALGRIASSTSRPVLESMLEDRDPQVVKEVREALHRLDLASGASVEPRQDIEVDILPHHFSNGREDGGIAERDGGP